MTIETARPATGFTRGPTSDRRTPEPALAEAVTSTAASVARRALVFPLMFLAT
jgi:hypothetical protein